MSGWTDADLGAAFTAGYQARAAAEHDADEEPVAEAPLLFGGVLPGLRQVWSAERADERRSRHLFTGDGLPRRAWCGAKLDDPQWVGLTLQAVRHHRRWCWKCAPALDVLRRLYGTRHHWTGER